MNGFGHHGFRLPIILTPLLALLACRGGPDAGTRVQPGSGPVPVERAGGGEHLGGEDDASARQVSFQRLGPDRSPRTPRSFPFLPDEPSERSLSFGTVTEGFLINGAELGLPGPRYRVCQRQLMRNLRFATDEMLALLTRVSEAVARENEGATLWLGNLSRRDGGDIPYSVSHNSGRDADLAFYYRDESGRLVDPPDLLVVGPDLEVNAGGVILSFDVPANWALVRALLSDPEVTVQYLFVANHLKRALLAHAVETGEPLPLIERATAMLVQPDRRNPHDDHFHVRVYCSEEDVEMGCVNSGRMHPWADAFVQAQARQRARVRRWLDGEDAATRAAAIRREVLLNRREDIPAIADRLGDDSPEVRLEAIRAMGALGAREQAGAIVEGLAEASEPELIVASIETLGALGGARALEFLMSALTVPDHIVIGEDDIDWRALIADALARLETSRAVEPLIPLLATEDPYLRSRVIWSLERLTNLRAGQEWEDWRLDPFTREHGLHEWEQWWQVHGTQPREQWILDGFALAGYPLLQGSGLDEPLLLQALDDHRSFVRYNAQRALMKLGDVAVESLRWSRGDARWYWRSRIRQQ